MRKSAIAICVLMFGASFLLLASAYEALPAELPVLRNPISGAVTMAPKSLFTAFRVPLMNLALALMATVMLSRTTDFEDVERRSSYFAFFSTLLFAIALKSDFEALEISGLARPFELWVTAGTAGSVVGGLALAFFRGRRARIPWTELRLSIRDKILLVGLFVSYLAMVTASLLISHRVQCTV